MDKQKFQIESWDQKNKANWNKNWIQQRNWWYKIKNRLVKKIWEKANPRSCLDKIEK